MDSLRMDVWLPHPCCDYYRLLRGGLNLPMLYFDVVRHATVIMLYLVLKLVCLVVSLCMDMLTSHCRYHPLGGTKDRSIDGRIENNELDSYSLS